MRTHGRISTYMNGCRCDLCREAKRDKAARLRDSDERRQREMVDADRARKIAAGLIRVARETPGWYADAACKGKTALFFDQGSTGGNGSNSSIVRDASERQALALCATCPVREPCREQARRDREQGIWGGETELDRARDGIFMRESNVRNALAREQRRENERRSITG